MVSIISSFNLRHRIRFMKILVISFRVSRSISLVLRQEIMMVFRHSCWIISWRFSWFSESKEKHLQASCWKIFSFFCMKKRSFPKP